MPTRTENLNTIVEFLRSRATEAERIYTSLRSMTKEQRDAVVTNDNYERSIQREYSIKELVAATHLEYHQVRYALIGANEKEYRQQLQPKALRKKGIITNYEDGKTKPKFRFDRDVLVSDIIAPVDNEVKPEPSIIDEVVPAPVAVTECNIVHLPRWVKTLHDRAFNADDIYIPGEDTSVPEAKGYMINRHNGYPIIGIMYVDAKWARDHGYEVSDEEHKVDTGVIRWEPTDYVTKEK